MTGFSQNALDPRTYLNMFEVFKQHFAQELEPLCPNWFEELTAKATRDEASAQHLDTGFRKTCMQENSARTPSGKPVMSGQILSTPKTFKSQMAQSPELLRTEEEILSPDRGHVGGAKLLPWVDTSPCLFGPAKYSQPVENLCNTHLPMGNFALLNTPNNSDAVSAKRISESLGAQIDPDVSWTSSLNTPPGMSSTVILTKEEHNTQSLSPSRASHVIFVQELFPKASKVSEKTETSSEMPDHPIVQPCGTELISQLDCLVKQSDSGEQDERGSLWKQMLSDAIHDGEVRSTVASVLDGAEDVLSIFFSKRNSSLPRVESRERSRKRQGKRTSSNEGTVLTAASAVENVNSEGTAKIVSRVEEMKNTPAIQKGNCSETKDMGVTQWTPLSLHDVLDTHVGINLDAFSSSTDKGSMPPSEGLIERQVDITPLENLRKADERYLDIVIPAGSPTWCDPVLHTSEDNTEDGQDKNLHGFHSSSPHSKPDTSKTIFENLRPNVLRLTAQVDESSKQCLDTGKGTMSESGQVNVLCSDMMLNGALAPHSGGSQLPEYSLQTFPSMPSTRKPPMKFVCNSLHPNELAENNIPDQRHIVSSTTSFPRESLNDGLYGASMLPIEGDEGVKCEKNTKESSECKPFSDGETNREFVLPISNEAENSLCYMSPLGNTIAGADSQGNPGRTSSNSSDAQNCLNTSVCHAEVRLKNQEELHESSPLRLKLKEKPGSAVHHSGRVLLSCPSHTTEVLTESNKTTETSNLLSASSIMHSMFERQRCDSGFRTMDVSQIQGSSHMVTSSSKGIENHPFVGFKTASNRVISLPQEAMQKAKAFLDEDAESCQFRMPVHKDLQGSSSTEGTYNSQYRCTKSPWEIKRTAKQRLGSLAQVGAPHQDHNSLTTLPGSAPKPSFVCFKTACNNTINLSPVNLLKAKQLFIDTVEEKPLEKCSSRHDYKVMGGMEAKHDISKRSVGIMVAPIPPSEQKGSEACGTLTASQRADVTELCSLLEEVDSQFEFTQVRQAKMTYNHPCDKEVDPDLLTSIDFNDSFRSACEKQVPVTQLSDMVVCNKQTVSSYHKQKGQEPNCKSKSIEALSCDSSDKIDKSADKLCPEHPSKCFGLKRCNDSGSFVAFSSASGKKITVSTENLKRASKVFDDLDIHCTPLHDLPDSGTDSSNTEVPCVSDIKMQRTGHQARNVLGTNVTLNIPRPNAIKHHSGFHLEAKRPSERCLKVGLTSVDIPTIKGDSVTSESNVPPPTSGLPTAVEENRCISGAVLKEPKAVRTKGYFLGDMGKIENLDISDNQSKNTTVTQQSAGFRTARGTAVNVSERFLNQARAMFADLEDNLQSTNGLDYNEDKEKRKDALNKCIESLGRSALGSINQFETTPKKGRNGNDTLSVVECIFKPNAMNLEKQSGITSVQSREKNISKMNSQSNIGHNTAKVLLESKAIEDEHDIESSCQKNVISDGNISTFSTQGNCDFSTACGKKVAVSKKSLQYAQSLLKECGEIKITDPGEKLGLINQIFSSPNIQDKNSGSFSPASGKGLSIFQKTHVQVKAVFQKSDIIPDSEMTKAVKVDCIKGKASARQVNRLTSGSGFLSVSSKGHSVSGKAPLEVKAMLNRDDAMDHVVSSGPKEGDTNSEACDVYGNLGKISSGFTSASGKRLSVSERALLKANALLQECDEKHHLESERLEFTRGSTQDLLHKKSCGFSTAGGRGVSVPAEAIQEAKTLFRDCDDISLPITGGEIKQETISEYSTSAHNDLEKSNCGFNTASGKMVFVSKKALLKVKTLLNESSEVESGGTRSPSKVERTTGTAQNPSCDSSCSFSMGSGKKEEAFCESGAAIKDCPNGKLPSDGWGKHLNVKGYDNPVKYNIGFSTASGNQVSVSLSALKEAKAKFRDCGDNSNTIISAEIKVDAVKMKSGSSNHNLDKNDSCVSTSDTVCISEIQSTKCMPVKSDKKEHSIAPSSLEHISQGMLNPDQTTGHHSTQLTRNDPVSPGGSVHTLKPSVLVKPAVKVEDWGMMQSSTDGAPQGGSSLLNLHSLGLRYCTVTQQKYLEQEAMACTRALLEDEDQAEFGLQGATEGLSQPSATAKSSDGKEAERSRGVKRLVSDDSDLTDQPPLKRQLLAEFDRTSDCGKKKMLNPLKSNPSVILQDRRTFRYGVPLQPKVTQPCGEKKAVLDQRPRKMEPQIIAPDSFFQDSKLANHRGTAFVPPFQRCPKPEAQRASQPQESRRPSSVFVPPFRKTQSNPNSNLGEGSGHAQHRFSEASPAAAVFSPPFKKTLSCTTDPGGDRKVSDKELVSHSLCDVECNVQGPVITNVPGEGEAQQERPTLTPASPDEHETVGSDPKKMLESLQLARDLQDMKIRKKRRQVIRPQPGSLFLAKTSGVTRVSLRSAVGGRYPLLHTKKELYSYGVHREVSQVSSNSAESFRFHCGDFFRGEVLTAGAGVQLADGGWLIPSDDGTAGKEEFYRALCDTPGVDPKLISEGWLYNHYRWVIWKRASMERSFPSVMGSHCLTPEQVLLQLKYRYDIEVDQSRRSALRKIIERDDTPAKTLVVCVCGILSTGSSSAPTPTRPASSETRTSPGTNSRTGSSAFGIIWVTDGWYAIKAVLDAPLTAMLLKGRIPIGVKLVTHGAELVGPQDACSPLEAPDSLMLKISANSTRRARWDTRLGFHSDPRPFWLPISSLHSNGGLVGCVDIVVLRSYPTQWMEKKPGGVFIFRNDRAEEREARRHADSKHKAMELLFTKIQTQFEKEQEAKTKGKRSRRLTNQEIEALQDGEELYEAVESDPIYLESSLNEQQLSMLNNYRQSLGQERQARLQERFQQALAEAQESEGSFPRRDVTPVWKLSICDFTDRQSRIVHLLNIWRPSMELRSLLKEGCRYRVYQLATSEGKKRGSSAVIQLTATKKTQFQQVQAAQECVPEFQPRVSVSFRALQGQGFSPLCGEVDIVGYVLSIAEKQGPSPMLYLVDEHQEFASVRIYAGLAQLGLEELVKPRTLLALSNLKLWHQSPTHLPALYAGELTVFSTKPKEPHLQEACSHLRSNVQGNKSFFQMAEERLSSFTRSSVPSSLLSPRKVGSSPKMGNGQMPQQSVQTLGFFTPLSRKPPLPVGASEDRDPKSLKRKRGLDFLSRIPSPPPLSPLVGGASPSVKNTFNPPRRSGTPHTTSHRQTPRPAPPPAEMAEWVNDEELAMINTQALIGSLEGQEGTRESR